MGEGNAYVVMHGLANSDGLFGSSYTSLGATFSGDLNAGNFSTLTPAQVYANIDPSGLYYCGMPGHSAISPEGILNNIEREREETLNGPIYDGSTLPTFYVYADNNTVWDQVSNAVSDAWNWFTGLFE